MGTEFDDRAFSKRMAKSLENLEGASGVVEEDGNVRFCFCQDTGGKIGGEINEIRIMDSHVGKG